MGISFVSFLNGIIKATIKATNDKKSKLIVCVLVFHLSHLLSSEIKELTAI